MVTTTSSGRACYQMDLCVALQLKVQNTSATRTVVQFAWWYCMALYGLRTPSAPLQLAGRGRNHTLRHRTRYHDYWCNEVRVSTVNTSSFVRQENDKAQNLFDAEIRRVQGSSKKFGTSLQRLLALLPRFEDDVEILLEVDPKLRDPLPQFQRMDGPSTGEGPLNSWHDARRIADDANRDLFGFDWRCAMWSCPINWSSLYWSPEIV